MNDRLQSERCRKRCPCPSAPCLKEKEAKEKALEAYETVLRDFAEGNGIPEEKVLPGLEETFMAYHWMQCKETQRHQEERKRIMSRFYENAGVSQEAKE